METLLSICVGLCLIPGGGVAAQQEVVIVDFGQERDGVPREWELSETEGKADLALVMDGSGPVLRLRKLPFPGNGVSFTRDWEMLPGPSGSWFWACALSPEEGSRPNKR